MKAELVDKDFEIPEERDRVIHGIINAISEAVLQ
jgi:hypothetical protein